MKELAQKNREKVIDVLTERLTFERAGVKLYDRIIEKMRESSERSVAKMLDQMVEHRDHEKEHEEWLEAQIRSLGGDAHGKTEKARLVERESKGIEEVILGDGATLPQMFHALMAAELVDNAGWDLLVELADEADDRQAKRAFKKRLREEEEHLIFVRRALEKFAMREVLAEPASMPTAP
jgi:bacterioferritin (cytochrome b1)